ncbi:helix-hairpin-helix domain-containing protein [Halomonas eurihalina]|uniref:Helix-hairpin-helix domain-containing protein n=1 Tax=Halomonas eurihalina TaxID=42566 RepID=A0A5D9DDZ0_HALER|nr:helix-hairpin-helix domain-containing protein [Halomonas eurihalina]MDR5858168.1 helix-hairpin-helix domain-containing protein [Halomonas eurihalina]TZG41330.1 helix-hairpin-helix domain-containing protein [Halomonas eurihalina]
MSFSDEERRILLDVKGVGATVIQRFEQLGYGSLAQLAKADVEHVVNEASVLVGGSCWKNSPQARSAVAGAIAAAVDNVQVGG